MRQYYYRNPDCRAASADRPDCICWHDEGTGPGGRWKEPRTWREKPAPAPTLPPPVISLVALDFSRDSESWTKLGVFSYHGQLPMLEDMPNTIDEDAILKRAEELGFHVSSAGGGAGQHFANPPWVQYFEKLIIITQSGGRDV